MKKKNPHKKKAIKKRVNKYKEKIKIDASFEEVIKMAVESVVKKK